jgi:hypothetical protein
MSTQSIVDPIVKEVKKPEANGKPAINSPPHFGDIGKAANDTFTKVPPLSLSPFYQLNVC